MDQGGTWHGGGLGPGHTVLDGDTAPLLKKGAEPPQSLAHVSCDQTAGWIKTPLGTEVDLGPGHFVLDGFPAIGEKETAAPLFSAHAHCGQGRPSHLMLSSCFILTWNHGLSVTVSGAL